MMQRFCHLHLHQTQGLSFISVSVLVCMATTKFPFVLRQFVCLAHRLCSQLQRYLSEYSSIYPLSDYKAKSNCSTSNCIMLFHCLAPVYIKKMSVCMYRQSTKQRVTYLDVVYKKKYIYI